MASATKSTTQTSSTLQDKDIELMEVDEAPAQPSFEMLIEEAERQASQPPENLPDEPDIVAIRNLRKTLGDNKASFRSPLQFQAAWAMQTRKHHLLIVSPPGSGKTLPFQMTMTRWKGKKIGILVEPYNLLYEQMKTRMESVGLSATIVSNTNLSPPQADVIIVGIEYFRTTAFQDWMSNMAGTDRLGMLVFDEAHTLAEDNHYRPTYGRSVKTGLELPNVTIVLLTGTAPVEHMHLLWEKLDLYPTQIAQFRTIRAPLIHRPNVLYQIVYPMSKDTQQNEWWLRVVRTLECRLSPDQCGAIFFNSKKACTLFADWLGCESITGDTSKDDRAKIYSRWKENRFLCMNKAGFYGGDVQGVSWVLHVEAPEALTDYLQSTGRAGRNGEQCLSVVVAPPMAMKSYRSYPASPFSGQNEMNEAIEAEKDCLRLPHGLFFDGRGQTCAQLVENGVYVLYCYPCALASGDPHRLKYFLDSEHIPDHVRVRVRDAHDKDLAQSTLCFLWPASSRCSHGQPRRRAPYPPHYTRQNCKQPLQPASCRCPHHPAGRRAPYPPHSTLQNHTGPCQLHPVALSSLARYQVCRWESRSAKVLHSKGSRTSDSGSIKS
jgi:hypothetical protein